MKLAIVQMSDTPQVESSVVMLRDAGYEVMVCGPSLRDELKRIGCDTVVSIDQAVQWGCDELDPSIKQATLKDMDRADLYCEIKVNNITRVKERWPRLTERIAFWRVNGARPEHVIRTRDGRTEDCGDECNPGAPTITNNFWYSRPEGVPRPQDNYTFWPPYPRASMFDPAKRTGRGNPFCLCHAVGAWGFGCIVPQCEKMGVDVYGVRSPKGKVLHSEVPRIVADGLCMVHLKGSDCPGWALYEALLGACPVVVARWLVARGLFYDLYTPETCFLFGVECDDTGRGDAKYDQCVSEINSIINYIRSKPDAAKDIALAGRRRLLKLMWNPERDGPGFKQYLGRMFA